MNLIHRRYCRSDGWAFALQNYIMPSAIGELDLGDDVLEIGPGPGRGTEWLRERVPHLTSIEIDHRLAEALKRRMAGTNVTVVEGDATAMPFPDGAFSAALSFTMLHHVPSRELQDRLLAETYRVLKPGGVFAGTDSTPTLRWRLFHVFDTCVPVDPDSLVARLNQAGFPEAEVHHNDEYHTLRFQARKG